MAVAGHRGCGPAPRPAPAGLRRALERAAAGLARPGRVEQAHAAAFGAEASRATRHPDRAAWDAAAARESLGQPCPLACALLRAADAAAAAADRDAAASRLQRAAGLAGQLRARPLLQQISRAARRARGEVTGGEVTAAAPFGLTGRRSLPHFVLLSLPVTSGMTTGGQVPVPCHPPSV